MLTELIHDLSHEQKTELYRRRITPQLITEWKKGRRLPTEVQVVDLAEVLDTDWAELQKEVTVMRAPEDRREEVARALRWKMPAPLSTTSSKV